jgi:hypothetical protein
VTPALRRRFTLRLRTKGDSNGFDSIRAGVVSGGDSGRVGVGVEFWFEVERGADWGDYGVHGGSAGVHHAGNGVSDGAEAAVTQPGTLLVISAIGLAFVCIMAALMIIFKQGAKMAVVVTNLQAAVTANTDATSANTKATDAAVAAFKAGGDPAAQAAIDAATAAVDTNTAQVTSNTTNLTAATPAAPTV